MKTEDLIAFKASMPDALSVWYDRMFELSKGQLIETIITRMTTVEMNKYLWTIQAEINTSRSEEKTDNGS